MLDAVQDCFRKRTVVTAKLIIPAIGIILGAEDGGWSFSSPVEKLQNVMLFGFAGLQQGKRQIILRPNTKLPQPLRVGVIHYNSHAIFDRLEFFTPSASSASSSSGISFVGRCSSRILSTHKYSGHVLLPFPPSYRPQRWHLHRQRNRWIANSFGQP